MSSARSLALRMLKSRLRSAWEIDQALLRREVEPAERREVIEQLIELDLINDERYARSYINTRDRLSPRGEYVLRMDLAKKGLAKEIIDQALRNRREEMEDDESDRPDAETQARQVIGGKMRAYAHLDPLTRNRRLTSLLMRRGFSYDVARRILEGQEG
jgi:regulatory protein